MPAQQLLIRQLQLLGNDGLPLAAGRAFFYLTGTTTLLPSANLQDVDGDPYANPVIADRAGYIPQPYYNGSSQVKVVIRTPGGVTVSTIDPVFMGENVNAAKDVGPFIAVAFGMVPSLPTAPVYVDNQFEAAMAGALAAGVQVLYLLPGLHFLREPHVVPDTLKLEGLGSFNNVRFGTTSSYYDELTQSNSVTTLVACGTGTKTYSVDYVTKGLQLGFRHENQNRLYTNTADRYFELTDFTNQNASQTTPATPRMFSALISYNATMARKEMSNIRVVTSCPDPAQGEIEGLGGYKRTDAILPWANWDIGVYIPNPWGCIFDRCLWVGSWQIAAHFSFGALPDGPIAGVTPNAEHGSYEHVYTQSGVEFRSGDLWPIMDKTASGVYVRWTPSHQFPAAGGTFNISQSDSFAGSLAYSYSSLTYVSGSTPNYGANTITTGWLLLNNVTPIGDASPDTSLIVSENDSPGSCSKVVTIFSGGHSHTQFDHCDFTDFAHCSGLDEANTAFNATGLPGRARYSAAFVASGAPMRALKFNNCKFTTSGPRSIHLGMARDFFLGGDCYSEARPYRTTLGGALSGVRGSAWLAGAITSQRSEAGNAASSSGRSIGNGFNDVVSVAPYRTTRPGTRMVLQTDSFYMGLGWYDIDSVFPLNTTNQLIMYGGNAQEIRIGRRDEDGDAKNYLFMRTTSAQDRLELMNNTLHLTEASQVRPGVDDSYLLGAPSFRWSQIYGKFFRPGGGGPVWTSGAGSPEGAMTGAVGSMFTRTDGGAGTTLYIKESGSGNTGWVAK